MVPLQTDNLVDYLGVVRIEHVEKVVICHLEEGFQAVPCDLENILFAKLMFVNLLALEVLGDVGAKEEGDLLFEVDWHESLDHLTEVRPAQLPCVMACESHHVHHALDHLATLEFEKLASAFNGFEVNFV